AFRDGRFDMGPGRPVKALEIRAVGGCFLLALLLAPAIAGAASGPGQGAGMELGPPVQQSLRQLSEGAIQWNKAFLQDDREDAKKELDRVLGVAQVLGMKSLPDLNLSTIALAVEAAEAGDFARADWALEAAERLDPDRPETLFGGSLVARLRGSYLNSLTDSFKGYLRLFHFPTERGVFLIDVALWVLVTLAVSSALFLLLQIALKSQAVGLDLQELLGRFAPQWMAFLLTGIILVAPLALPGSLFWLLLVWSVILWGYCSLQERFVLIAIWLFFGAVPFALEQVERQFSLVTSPAYQVVYNLREGRLYGRLFTDLEVLRTILPKSIAVRHVEGDLHASLDQWDQARATYAEVLEAEPNSAAVLNNLGVYFFIHGDNGGAAQHFQRATSSDLNSAIAFFNLSQAYSNDYLYKDARRALEEAQRIDPEAVGAWIQENQPVPVRLIHGGLQRIPQIRRELLEARGRPQATGSSMLQLARRWLSLIVSAAVLLMALTLHLARRGFGYSEPVLPRMSRSAWAPLLSVLVPGLSSAGEGKGIAAFMAFVPPVALLALPFSEVWGVRIPWGFDPGGQLLWVVATLGLVVILLVRLLRYRSLEA
ncbi:MAG: tetratricopeptide repeat protein, partial [Acidobacteria bacterium]|nr:tetratricopeptide repeat protein [Acidobacteriota bacterium]